ncbi:uncharacterized protein LOC141690410 [Apium graveolens]|uniref:uncharacterized protein LOC141690410 n=1 Tax=Apium graveolens TaxID=4045 RepID=UPI003D7BA6E2
MVREVEQRTSDLDNQKKGGRVEHEHTLNDSGGSSAMEILNASVKEHILSGSKLPPAEIARFWNVRGFNQPFKRKEVENLILDNQIGLCGLIETIVLGWNPDLFEVMEIFTIDQVIHWVVTLRDSKISFRCSLVYVANKYVDMRSLWKSICSYIFLTSNSSWIMMGDFNAMLSDSECLGGAESHSPSTQEFQDCINFIGVQDVSFSGITYTWAGSPQGVGVVKNLDRVVANLDFFPEFWRGQVSFLSRGVSDHSPVVVELSQARQKGKRLVDVQNQLDLNPFDDSLKTRESIISREHIECKLEEERLLKQRAKVHWLKVGDCNSKFFHKSLQARRVKKTVIEIENDEGECLQGVEMNNHFVEFYKQLLGSKDHCEKYFGLENYAKKLEPGIASEMVIEVTNEEIRVVIFAMGDDKAAGPDGYSALFFKKAWPVIGNDLCVVILEFFRTGKLLKEVNATLIALIPKEDHPRVVGGFRPISHCNIM